ncbi:MAG: Ig domain-containing protein [Clostridiales bacterium]|nr:Ig domain-containing protein [Clostridiales bacterium]
MKKTVIIILAVLPIFLLVTIAFAGKILSYYQDIAVERVAFVDILNNEWEEDDKFEIQMGTEKATTIRIYPEYATNKEVTYTSSDESICTVNENGVIYGVSYGNAQILVTTKDGNRTAFLNVLVRADKVIGVTLPVHEKTLNIGDSFKLTPEVQLPVADNKNVLFASSNPAVAKVNASGEITALSEGTAKISVTTVDGEYTDTCTVTVIKGIPTLVFDFTNADFITKAGSTYVTSTPTISLNDYIVFNPEKVNKEDIHVKATSNGSAVEIDQNHVLTFKKNALIQLMVYVGDEAKPVYQSKILLEWK